MASGVFAGPLPQGRRVAFGIENVVGDLERGADRGAIGFSAACVGAPAPATRARLRR